MGATSEPLCVDSVAINCHCAGLRWSEKNRPALVRLIALVAMGQAAKAALIIQRLEPATPEFTHGQLCAEAIVTLSVQDTATNPRKGYPKFQRDGFIFEAISWIAATQTMGDEAVLKPPHVSATSQGLDGLMLGVDKKNESIKEAIIFEDKCTDNPRSTFLSKVLPALIDRHTNKRSVELVATASLLLSVAGFSPDNASRESARILDLSIRKYRSSFAVTDEFDTEERRSHLFGRFEDISGVGQDQRIGACFVVSNPMRDWFEQLAADAISYIESL
jgi:hypothetical protein